jgi:hypothetical protein
MRGKIWVGLFTVEHAALSVEPLNGISKGGAHPLCDISIAAGLNTPPTKWLRLLALIPKPVVVANGYLIGQHTVALMAQFSGENYLSLERLDCSIYTRQRDHVSRMRFYFISIHLSTGW